MLPTVATDPQSVKREQKAVPRNPPAHPAEQSWGGAGRRTHG
jgi:hypothetical protein